MHGLTINEPEKVDEYFRSHIEGFGRFTFSECHTRNKEVIRSFLVDICVALWCGAVYTRCILFPFVVKCIPKKRQHALFSSTKVTDSNESRSIRAYKDGVLSCRTNPVSPPLSHTSLHTRGHICTHQNTDYIAVPIPLPRGEEKGANEVTIPYGLCEEPSTHPPRSYPCPGATRLLVVSFVCETLSPVIVLESIERDTDRDTQTDI